MQNAKFWGLGAIALLLSTFPIPAMAEATDNSDSVPYRLLLPLLQTFFPPGTDILGGASTADRDTAILETSLHHQTVRTFYRTSLTHIPHYKEATKYITTKARNFRSPY